MCRNPRNHNIATTSVVPYFNLRHRTQPNEFMKHNKNTSGNVFRIHRRRISRRLHYRQVKPYAGKIRVAATVPAGGGRVFGELLVADANYAWRERRRRRRGPEQRLGGVVASNWHEVAGQLAPNPGVGDGHGSGEMTQRRNRDEVWRRRRRVGFGLRGEEADAPHFGVGRRGPRGASPVHGRKAGGDGCDNSVEMLLEEEDR